MRRTLATTAPPVLRACDLDRTAVGRNLLSETDESRSREAGMSDKSRPLDPLGRPARTPADQATVRRSNLGLVLRHLRDSGSRSRARIAQETGLNKATVSSLVAELTDRRAGQRRRHRPGRLGRPPRADRASRRHRRSAASASSSTSTTPRPSSSTCAARCCSSTGSPSTSRRSAPDRTLDAVAGLVGEAAAAAAAARAPPRWA